MTEAQILERARTLMNRHGLADWTVKTDRARRRAGACIEARKCITLSVVLLREYSPKDIDQVILHEVAHALAGARHGHDSVWKAQAAALGVRPRATMPAGLPAPEAVWVGVCPRCGARRELYRAPRRVTSCGSCSTVFDRALILRWECRGVPAVPAGAYAKELARLRLA